MYGGVEAVMTTVARHSGPPTLESHFALCYEGRLSDELIALGAHVAYLGLARLSLPHTVLRARRRLAGIIATWGMDVAVVHSAWSLAMFGPMLRRCGVPIVFWQHGPVAGQHWLERLASRIEPDIAICNSRFTQSTLGNLFPDVTSRVLYCPAELQQPDDPMSIRTFIREQLGVQSDAVVIVQFGRFERWKGHEVLLRALSRLDLKHDWICWQVGGAQQASEAGYVQELLEFVQRAGIADRVQFLGERKDIKRLLLAADIHCQPNTGPEGFGLSFIEAMAARLPVVTTNIGAAAELLTEETATLVRPGDPDALACELERLILNGPARARLGRAGPTRAKLLCDPARQAQVLAEFLREAVQRHAHAAVAQRA
jgi:glycosyltransferase involved in cell wall biosynthesis